MRKLVALLAVIVVTLACTPANGSEAAQRGKPRVHPAKGLAVDAVGPDLHAVFTWQTGTADSITFTASTLGGTVVASKGGAAPFSGVDTLVIGPRPAPGVSVTYDFNASGTYTDRGAPTPFTLAFGQVTYTEPQPPGVPPSGDSVVVDTTLGSLPPSAPDLVALDVVVADADSGYLNSYFVTADSAYQLCALALMSDGLWKQADSTNVLPGTAASPADTVMSASSVPLCQVLADGRNTSGAMAPEEWIPWVVAQGRPLIVNVVERGAVVAVDTVRYLLRQRPALFGGAVS